MATRLAGNSTAFWNNVAAGAGTTSNAVELPRRAHNLAIYVTSSGATTISLQAGHSGDISGGILSDSTPSTWFKVYYTNIPAELVLAGAGSATLLIPDFVAKWVRLHTTGAVTLTAGWEASGE